MNNEEKNSPNLIQKLVNSLKQKWPKSSSMLAMETFEALNELVEITPWKTIEDLNKVLRGWVSQISEHCRPRAIIAENVAFRILRIINDVHKETFEITSEAEEYDSLSLLLRGKSRRRHPSNSAEPDLNNIELSVENFKCNLYEALGTYKIEIETSCEDIGRQALQHIHSNETIMVYGYSRTVEGFLKTAAKSRKFRLIIAEEAPEQKGHRMAKSMASSDIEITLIPDSCIFAIMARVNKVIIGSCVISADGSLSAPAGTNALALSAFHHGVPVLVCSGLYKLSPRYTTFPSVSGRDVDYSFPVCPDLILDYDTAGSLGDVEVLNPSFDHVSAKLVTLFLTNIGAQSPSYMYHIIKEIYHPNDIFVYE